MLLTPAQLQEIVQIIEDRHAAFIVNTIGPEAVTPEVLEKLKELGIVDAKLESIKDAYLYGQVVAAAVPGAKEMSYDQFKAHVQKNPIPLTEIETQAVAFAEQHAAQYCRGLGNRVNVQTGEVLIEADAGLRAQMRDTIRTTTQEGIAKRKAMKAVKSDLGWATGDWSRDWERIANTEKQFAMQQGTKDYIAKRAGPDARVAVRVQPDRCPKCAQLFERNGSPIIFRLADLEGNGTNVGKKQADWQPVVPPVHPHCFLPGMMVATDRGQIPIEEVKPGDLALTGKGRWRPVTHVWSSVYEGEVSTIQTDDAAVTATANHPFQSGDAWITAGLLDCGDELRYFRSDGLLTPDIDPQYEPSVLVEYRRFASILFGFSRSGVPVTAINLDGEFYVREGEIDQEAIDSIADDGSKSSTTERLVDPLFHGRFYLARLTGDTGTNEVVGLGFSSDRSVEGCEVGSPFFWRKLTHSNPLRLRPPPWYATTPFDAMHDRSSAHAELGGYFFYREQVIEVHLEDTEWFDLAPKRIGCHGEMVADGVPIVNVSSRSYRGLVYNLTVEEDHTFVVNGLVVHNCQCQLIHVPPGYGFDEQGRMVLGGERQEMGKSDVYWALRQEDDLRKAMKTAKRIEFQGIPIALEQLPGDVRKWTDGEESGRTMMTAAYGYVVGTEGADTDEVDVFVGPHPKAPTAYVIHQQNPKTGTYDEDKVILGALNEKEAMAIYQAHYDRTDFAVGVSPMPIDAFKRWVAGTAPRPYGLVKSETALVVKLIKANVRSAGTFRGNEEAAHGINVPDRSFGGGAGMNIALDNRPAERQGKVDLAPTGDPHRPDKVPYTDAAVKRDLSVYEVQEPVKPRTQKLVIQKDYKASVLGSGETERNREKVERLANQDEPPTDNTVEPEDAPEPPKSKKPKRTKAKLKDEKTGETLH